MALIIADRVKETATTTGTGTFTLGGAVTGFRTFNTGIGTGNTTYYCIFLDGTNEFEVGLGTYTAPDQLARDTVLASSNSGSKVDFSQGIKSVFCTQPSSKAAYLDASGNLSITTSNITEGTNLYYTDARFDTRLATKDTADLSEGTNLYYTDARARAAISVSGNAIAYNSSTGVITANFEESPTFTGNVVVSGDLTVTGTTTWLDSTNTQISDKNIVLNYASGDSSANADGAGITIQDAVDASNDATILWDASNDEFNFSHGITLPDSKRLKLGTDNDLQIYHNGFASVISDVGTGDLYIGSDNSLLITDSNLSEVKATFATNGAVTLYHDNAAKLATTSSGIDVTGTVVADGLNLGTTGNATLANILSADNTSNTLISGGNATNAGANYALFGGSHASLANVHRWRNGSTEIARFDASGNLGIGTTSPSQILHLEKSDDPMLLITRGSSNRALLGDTGSNNGGDLLLYNSSGSNTVLIRSGADSYLNGGNVGIGTSSPSVPLHVAGGSSGTNQSLFRTSSGGGGGFQIVCSDLSVANPTWQLNTFFGEQLAFGDGTTEKMRLDSSGNVGIGTTSPTSLLEVSDTSGDVDFKLRSSNTGSSTIRMGDAGNISAGYIEYDNNVNNYIFATSNTEAMRIHSNGAVTLNNASKLDSAVKFQVSGSSSGVTSFSSYADEIIFEHNTHTGITLATPNTQAGTLAFADPENVAPGWIQYDHATNNMNFRAGNAERMRINSTGLGIGTTSPAAMLHVAQGSGANTVARFENTSQAKSLVQFQDTSTSTRPRVGSVGDNLILDTANTERVRIDSSGNVGIGTDSPSQKLTVDDGTGASTIGLQPDGTNGAYIRYGGSSGTVGNTLRFLGVGNTEYARFNQSGNFGIGTSSPTHKLQVSGQSRLSTNIYDASQATLRVVNGGNAGDIIDGQRWNGSAYESVLSVKNSGNVGINTTSPNAKLEIVGIRENQIRLSSSDITVLADEDIGGIEFYSNDTGNTGVTGFVTATSEDNIGTTKLRFGTGTAGSASEKLTILSSGNVGIGTTSPSEKLDIDGDSIRLRQSQTPASATATGSQGQIAWDSNYMYVCVATNTWKRVALSTW